jgi:hypothetical protein
MVKLVDETVGLLGLTRGWVLLLLREFQWDK